MVGYICFKDPFVGTCTSDDLPSSVVVVDARETDVLTSKFQF